MLIEFTSHGLNVKLLRTRRIKEKPVIVLEEKDVTPEKLLETARKLLFDEDKKAEMSKNLTSHAVLDASERIYSEILNAVR